MIQSPSEYLFNKTKQEQTPFIINEHGGFYMCKDLLIPKEEFEQILFPMADKVKIRNEGQYKGDGIGSAGI